MNDQLRRYLTPDDDGRAFTEAVLLRASGALHRRRAARQSPSPAWIWLERWARPWIIAALVGLSLAIVLPGLSHDEAATVSATPTLTSDLTGASTGTTFVLAETVGN
jgi:hypothetical protein